MDRRRALVAVVCVGAYAALCPAHAQKISRIGFLAGRSRSTPSKPDHAYDAFAQALHNLGYNATNAVVEWRFADGDYERLPALAAQLAALKVHVIVTHIAAGIRAAQKASSSTPIVAASVADPVALGFANSLARPGGNVTGLTNVAPDIAPKQFELLGALLPKLARVALLLNPNNPSSPVVRESAERAAARMKVTVIAIDAATAQDIDAGLAAAKRDRAQALVIPSDGFFLAERAHIASLTGRQRLPCLSANRELVAAGALMSYGPDVLEQYRRAAAYVDKILKGAKAGDLPFEQPTKFDLVINLKTAKAFGISVPKQLVLRADEVIE